MTFANLAEAGLLASNWQRMGDRFSGRSARLETSEIVTMVAMCVVAGLAIWLLNWLANRQQKGATLHNPKRLFRELCRSHGINRRQQALLQRLAALAGLEQPAELFVRPDLFDPSGVPEQLAEQAAVIEQFGRLLFADLEEVEHDEEGGHHEAADDEWPEEEEPSTDWGEEPATLKMSAAPNNPR